MMVAQGVVNKRGASNRWTQTTGEPRFVSTPVDIAKADFVPSDEELIAKRTEICALIQLWKLERFL